MHGYPSNFTLERKVRWWVRRRPGRARDDTKRSDRDCTGNIWRLFCVSNRAVAFRRASAPASVMFIVQTVGYYSVEIYATTKHNRDSSRHSIIILILFVIWFEQIHEFIHT